VVVTDASTLYMYSKCLRICDDLGILIVAVKIHNFLSIFPTRIGNYIKWRSIVSEYDVIDKCMKHQSLFVKKLEAEMHKTPNQ